MLYVPQTYLLLPTLPASMGAEAEGSLGTVCCAAFAFGCDEINSTNRFLISTGRRGRVRWCWNELPRVMVESIDVAPLILQPHL